MPELPEVETVRRGLDPALVGRTITSVDVWEPRLRWPVDPVALGSLVGRQVERVSRRAKYLLVDVGGDLVWLVHLGMSGRLLLVPTSTPTFPHENLRVELGDLALAFRDPRRFGSTRVAPRDALRELDRVGPEPLETAYQPDLVASRLRKTRREVKAALLDQRVVAGIGNIYASEILFRAGVRPSRRGHRLRLAEATAIARAIPEILGRAVELGGTTFSDFQNAAGGPGRFQRELAVFRRTGEACLRCATPIVRRVAGGRSDFFCPRCQR